MTWQRFRRPSTRLALAATAVFTLAIPALRSPGASLPARAHPVSPTDSLALIPSRSPAQADSNRNRLVDDLEARLATASAKESLGVIVRYKPGREPAPVAGRGDQRLAFDHSVATHLTPAAIRQLLADDAVESVEEDTVYHAVRDTAEQFTGSTKASRDFGLSGDGDGDPTTFSARDHTIAIVDTGIDGKHQDFAGGKIIAWQDLVNGKTDPYDDEGHGTHVASIAAGEANSAGVSGVAPGAALAGIKVLNSQGEGKASTIAQGIEWCITNRAQYGIEALNLSLGSDRSSSGTDLLSRTVNHAVAAGIVVTIAAGNSGPRQRTIGSPAAASEALAVGSVADPGAGGFYLDSYSSRGPTADGRVKPDICAPGERILAARANSGSGYVRFSGTSMAAPFVAGVAALIRQANPSLTAPEVKTILKETAVHFGSEGENSDFGAGRMDAYAALARAAGKPGSPPSVPAHMWAGGTLKSADDSASWELSLGDPGFPVAVTLIQQGTGGGFSLEVYDPAGELVARSTARSRQAFVTFRPGDAGTYSLVVHSGAGGDYSLDVSAGSDQPLKESP